MVNVENFKKAWTERIIDSEKETIQILREFEKKKKRVFRDYEEKKKQEQDKNEEVTTEEKLAPFKEILGNIIKKILIYIIKNFIFIKKTEYTNKIKDQLMEVEVQLVEELDFAIHDFYGKQSEIISNDIDPLITAG